MKTDFETLKALALFTTDHLKEKGMIDFVIAKREILIEAMATEFGVCFSTDESIRDEAIEDVEDKMGVDNLPEDVTESEMFNHARKEIIKTFNGENIGGLYLIESLHQIAHRMTKFLLNSDHIEDVFGTDEDLVTFLVSVIRSFNPKRENDPR